jgi:hypothetical protein
MYDLLPNTMIPPKDQIVTYANSLLADVDYCCDAYGEVALNAINAFIKKYPDVPELLRTKGICLSQLGHSSYFVSLFSKNSENEFDYLSELEKLVLEYKKVPDNAWSLCAHLYSRAFTCITSNKQGQESYVKILSDLLEKLPDNQHLQRFLAEGLQTICQLSYEKNEVVQYLSSLKVLAGKYPTNEEVVLPYADTLLLLITYANNLKEKLDYLHEITTLEQEHTAIKNLLVIRVFALLFLLVDDEDRRPQYVQSLSSLLAEHDDLPEILGNYEWNTSFEHFCGPNKSKMRYCDTMLKIVELFPDLPDFVMCHSGIFIGLINVNGKAPYRDDFFGIIQQAARKFPERTDIQRLYAKSLVYMSRWLHEDNRYFETLKSLSEHFNQDAAIRNDYLKALSNLFEYRQEVNYYELYGPLILKFYQEYPENEYACEAYVRAMSQLVMGYLSSQADGDKQSASTVSDSEKYFVEIQKIANRYPKNASIAERYLRTLCHLLENRNAENFWRQAKDEAIRFSYLYPNDYWGDTTYDCYDILENYFLRCQDHQEQRNCLDEMERIVAAWNSDDHQWYIAKTLTYMIEKQTDEPDKERFHEMLKRHCFAHPDSSESVIYYAQALNDRIRQSDSSEKVSIFGELEEWTLSHPGNPYLLQEYALGLLIMAEFLSNENHDNDYIFRLKEFAQNYPKVIHRADMEENIFFRQIMP